jgi:hypothetical protein
MQVFFERFILQKKSPLQVFIERTLGSSLLQKRPIFTFLLAQRQKLGHQSEFADKQ